MMRYTVALALASAVALSGCTKPPATMSGYVIVTGTLTSVPPSVPFSGQGTATVTISCLGQTVPVGGGYSSGDDAADVVESLPQPGGHGWRVTVRNANIALTSIPIMPVVVCVDEPASYHVVTGTPFDLSSQQLGTATAGCPNSTDAIVGGGFHSPDYMTHVFSSAESSTAPRSWSAQAKNNFAHLAPSRSTFVAIAVCAGQAWVPGRVTVSSNAATLAPNSKTTLTASCPAGTKVLSASLNEPTSLALWTDSRPMPDGKSWTATLKNTSSFIDNVTITGATVTAICASA